MAAGVGERLRLSERIQKVLLKFGDETLLSRHIRILRCFGIERIDITVGFRHEEITAELERIGAGGPIHTHYNPDFQGGSILSLLALKEIFESGEPLIFLDGDVLYDGRLMERLLEDGVSNCFLMDRNMDPGEDPVKLCFLGGRIVDFHKKPENAHDEAGEWIGFARFSADAAAEVAAAARIVAAGRRSAIYEEAFREVILAGPAESFGACDITGLPWVEIDFPEDLEKAAREVFPLLRENPE